MSLRASGLLILAIALGGCALPRRAALAPEGAASQAQYGLLSDYGRRIEAMLGSGESAHWLLDRNRLALEARLALADTAAATLDVQYFIWQDDASGQLLARRLLAAADRGVKIRLLLDDFTMSSGRGDIAKLDAHPQIEVRTFNPWAIRSSRLGTAAEFVTRPYALNRRMHNKTFIADKRFAILGGRNIGDRYFGIYERFVQNDLDVLVAGQLVDDIADTFDSYWNSEHSFPVVWFARDPRPRQSIDVTRADLDAAVARSSAKLSAFPLEETGWSKYFETLVDEFSAGQARVIWESPDIFDGERERVYAQFKRLVAAAKREVLISSPYFIPDEEFRTILKNLVARGVRVAVVTNSLATNNHVVAHTGYRRWRREVLAAGIELYELRADAAALALYVTPPVQPQALGLHTKAVVVDGEQAFVGSPNVDPRSMVYNTEIGIVSDSSAFAGEVRDLIARDMEPQNAWRVSVDDNGWLTWSNGERTLKRQPAKGFLQRSMEFLLNLLPLKRQA